MPDRLTHYTRDGLTFDVVDSGPVDGAPIVLLHGFPQRATSWKAVTAILNAQGFRTYAPDQRGYSPGARPTSRTAYTMSTLVDDVVALTDAIGSPVHLVGHDWGAAVAWAVAGRHPESVRTLTAVSVGHISAFLKALATTSQGAKSWYMQFFQLPVLPERWLSKRGGGGENWTRKGGVTDEMYETFQREVVESGALTGGLNWYRAMPLSLTEPRGHISVPTALVWGRDDYFLGRKQAEGTKDYVDGPYEFVELDAGHWIPDLNAPELAEVIVRQVK